MTDNKQNKLTPKQARKLTVDFLKQNDIPFDKVKAKIIGFSDLARSSRVFVDVVGWRYKQPLKPLQDFAKANGFYVEISNVRS